MEDVCGLENSVSSRSVAMVMSLLGLRPPIAAFTAITRRQADRVGTAERQRQRPERSGGRRAAAILFRDAKPEIVCRARVGGDALRRRKIAVAPPLRARSACRPIALLKAAARPLSGKGNRRESMRLIPKLSISLMLPTRPRRSRACIEARLLGRAVRAKLREAHRRRADADLR